MYRYIRFAVLGAFLLPSKMYWIILAVCAASVVLAHYTSAGMRLGGYTDAEQDYDVTIGYVVDGKRVIPKRVYYTDNGVRKLIPTKDTSITRRGHSDIYDTYARIRRRDGTGYDYIAAMARRVSDTSFKIIKCDYGRELI